MQGISFTVDDQKIVGTIFHPQNTNIKHPAILFVHGWMSSQESAKGRASELVKLGFVCMTFSMRGHGESEGDIKSITRKEFLEDVMHAYDFLVDQNDVESDNISVVGASFGAYLAALLSSKRKIKNLVLRVPADYPNESFNKPQMEFSGNDDPKILQPKFRALKSNSHALEALKKFAGDVLVIESEMDVMIPHETIMNFVNSVKDKSKVKHVVMMGADHSIKDEKLRAVYTKILVDWFRKRL